MLKPVRKQSLSDAVFAQLRDQIVNGEMPPGSPLPAERVLCEALGVNRGSVREALKRLQQSRLVSVRHGGTSHVLDYRASAGLDLLADLVLAGHGRFDPRVVRGIVEMRSALAPDIARRAAERRTAAQLSLLNATLVRMREHAGDLPALQGLAVNSGRTSSTRPTTSPIASPTTRCARLTTSAASCSPTCWPTRSATSPATRAIATAVEQRDGDVAARRARALIERGERGIKQILDHLPAQPLGDARMTPTTTATSAARGRRTGAVADARRHRQSAHDPRSAAGVSPPRQPARPGRRARWSRSSRASRVGDWSWWDLVPVGGDCRRTGRFRNG